MAKYIAFYAAATERVAATLVTTHTTEAAEQGRTRHMKINEMVCDNKSHAIRKLSDTLNSYESLPNMSTCRKV